MEQIFREIKMMGEKGLKVLKTERDRERSYIFNDQSISEISNKDIEDLPGDLKVWYKESLGCCDDRWKMNKIDNLDIKSSNQKFEVVFEKIDEYPEVRF